MESVEDADVVYDEALVFAGVGSVDSGDGLEEVVVSEGFVEVHGFEDGGVESCEEHVADDEDVGFLVFFLEFFAGYIQLLAAGEVVGFQEFLYFGVLVPASAEDYLAVFGGQVLVQFLLD